MAKIPPTADVRDSVARQLGVPTAEIAAYSVRATVLPHVNALAIEVLGPDPERCREVATAAGATTRRRVRELYPVYALRELEPARATRQPVSPNVRRDAALAALLGFFLGGLALAAWSALPVSRRAV
jgi:capsular polysaccharide biosynthesis protein